MIYFTADTHFYHSNIIALSSRPFTDVEEMNQTLIQNWNSCVTVRDEIYILGDFFFKGTGEEANNLLKNLNGKKYLIRGNHDNFVTFPDFDIRAFRWVKDYFMLNYQKRKFILFHYPILEWQGFFKGAIHLYGHVHAAVKDSTQSERLDVLGKNAINVGVDVNNFFPHKY